jgi:hypothetical protein
MTANCPACGRSYDPCRIPPPRVPMGISCACCCPADEFNVPLNVSLHSGRIVRHRRAATDKIETFFMDEPQEMTNQEWLEYRDAVVARVKLGGKVGAK